MFNIRHLPRKTACPCLQVGAADGVGGGEAAEAVDVIAHHGVIVAGLAVALIGGEKELVAGGVVPGFAEGIVAHLGGGVAAGIGDEAMERWSWWWYFVPEESILARRAEPE